MKMKIKLNITLVFFFLSVIRGAPNGDHNHHPGEGDGQGPVSPDIDEIENLSDLIKELGIQVLGKDQENADDVSPGEDHDHINVKALISELFSPSSPAPPSITTLRPTTSTQRLPIKSHWEGWLMSPVALINNNFILEPVYDKDVRATTQSSAYLTESPYHQDPDQKLTEKFTPLHEDNRSGKGLDLLNSIETDLFNDKPIMPAVDTRWANFRLVNGAKRRPTSETSVGTVQTQNISGQSQLLNPALPQPPASLSKDQRILPFAAEQSTRSHPSAVAVEKSAPRAQDPPLLSKGKEGNFGIKKNEPKRIGDDEELMEIIDDVFQAEENEEESEEEELYEDGEEDEEDEDTPEEVNSGTKNQNTPNRSSRITKEKKTVHLTSRQTKNLFGDVGERTNDIGRDFNRAQNNVASARPSTFIGSAAMRDKNGAKNIVGPSNKRVGEQSKQQNTELISNQEDVNSTSKKGFRVQKEGRDVEGGIRDQKSVRNLGQPPSSIEQGSDCEGRKPGLYPDIEAQCKKFIACHENGRMGRFSCPAGTLFNPVHQICDWKNKVKCSI